MEKFQNIPGRFEAKRLSAMNAAELLGTSERRFREEALEGLVQPLARQGLRAAASGGPG